MEWGALGEVATQVAIDDKISRYRDNEIARYQATKRHEEIY